MRSVPIIAAVLLAGCAGMAHEMARTYGGEIVPGRNVSDELAGEACGSVEAYEELRAGYHEAYLASSSTIRPRVDDDECEVLAKVGVPDRATTYEHEYGEGFIFTWYTGSLELGNLDAHVVRLEGGRVVSVAW